MPDKRSYSRPDVIRGRLTDAEKERIEALVFEHGDNPPRLRDIAKKLNRHPATVTWFMLTNGLLTRKPRTIAAPYVGRDGITRYPWSDEQDAVLLELRTAGLKPVEIAPRLAQRFGIPRNEHSCRVRLVMLAATED